jgi:lysophospholipase L1-like esterase
MERVGKIVMLLLCLSGAFALFGQEDLTPPDSIPPIPTFTDTLALDSIPMDTMAEPEQETYIDFDANRLQLFGDSSGIARFYAKLARVMKTHSGNVRILHVGGSHIQAGTMSHCIRKHLLDTFGLKPASRGFIFPYSAASRCNNPYDYRVAKAVPFELIRNVYAEHKFPLGAGGIAVWTADGQNSITVKMNDTAHDFAADTVVLLGSTKGWPVDPILKEDTVYHFPDSIDDENGRYYFFLNHEIQVFSFYFPCSKGDTFIVHGIILLNGRPGITLSTLGVNGAQVTSYLRCQNFERDIRMLAPDLVIFSIGVNDAYGSDFDTVAFQQNYIRLAEQVRRASPDCAFIFVTNNDTWKKGRKGRYYVNKTGPEVQEAMSRIARHVGGAVWDQFAVMGGLGSMETWRRKGLAQKDHVHFTAAGYNLMGDLFWNAFIQELSKYTDESE